MDIKGHLFSLRFFFLFSFLFFLFSAILGFLGAKFFPDRALYILTILKAIAGEVATWERFKQFVFVVLNNSFLLFLIPFLSSFFGIFPILVLFSNGAVLGALIFFLKGSLPISLFLISILPHGILEIPILILSCAWGLKIAKKTFNFVLAKESGLRKEIFLATTFFFKILIPFLALAALIEIYFVPYLLNKLS